jgi:uncharacterized delta-60 repeat protein
MGKNRTELPIGIMILFLMANLIVACSKDEGPWAVTTQLDPGTAHLNAGEKLTFTGTVTGHQDPSVTWSVFEPEGGTITDGGIYTAPLTQGTFHVVATSVGYPAARASATVTVSFPPGALDPSFGTGGKATIPIGLAGSQANALAIQSDGKILASGGSANGTKEDIALVRLQTDGTVDSSFGTNGTRVIASTDSAVAIAIQPADGKIVAVGSSLVGSDFDFTLIRLETNGTLDPSFGAGGTRTIVNPAQNDSAAAVAVQSDGKIIIAGSSLSGSDFNTADFELIRVLPDGTPDPSFGTGGRQTTDFNAKRDSATALALQADGKIIVAGLSVSGANSDFALARYNTDGGLDITFGAGGKVTTQIGSGNAQVASLAIQPDGKIVAAGVATNENGLNTDFALARYNVQGTLDPTFGTGGKVTTDLNATDDVLTSLGLQSDGKIVAAGSFFNGTNDDFALVRYNADGTLDSTFGVGGKMATPFGAGNDAAAAMVIQGDGKIVAAGRAASTAGNVFALARYWP